MENEDWGPGPSGVELPSTQEVDTAFASVVATGDSRRTRRTAAVTALGAVAAVAIIAATAIAAKPGTKQATPAATSLATTTTHQHPTSTSLITTTTLPINTPAPKTNATFDRQGDPAEELIGLNVGQLKVKGYEPHQISYFGTEGAWSLFTVTKDGKWFAFTAKNYNQMPDLEPGTSFKTLDDTSRVLGAETLAPLAENHWYGVQGVVRNGKSIGGVMMEGVGYERQADNTFPVVKAYHVNLQTLRLEKTSTKGLDIVESCG